MAQCQCPAAPTITGEQQHHLHAGQHPIQLATASHSDVFRFGLNLQVKLVLQRNKLFVESPDKQVLQRLLKDSDISAAHAACGGGGITSGPPLQGLLRQRVPAPVRLLAVVPLLLGQQGALSQAKLAKPPRSVRAVPSHLQRSLPLEPCRSMTSTFFHLRYLPSMCASLPHTCSLHRDA